MLKQSVRWITIAQEKGKIGSKVFQMIMKQQPLSILNLLNRFSYSPTPTIIDLNKQMMEQKAIVAFYTLQYIQNIDQSQFMNDNRSLRERIFSLDHLTKNLLNKAIQFRKITKQIKQDPLLEEQIQKLQIQEIYKIFEKNGFEKNNIQDIIKAYDLKEGITIDCKGIWQQQRFVDALSPNGKMVLLPNFGTKIIFNQITLNIKRCIISGDKGSGKSFAYLNYDYLSKFITNYRIYLAENRMTYSEKFQYLVDKKQFQRIKRLFYFPLKQVNQYYSLQRTFQDQIHFINEDKLTKKLTNMQKSLKLQNFLTSINNYFFAYKIDTVCVADEANAYLSAYRQLLKQYTLDRITLLERYSNIFNCVKYKFTLLIYNSSQEVEAQELHYWSNSFRDSTGQIFHDPYEHDKQDNHLHIPYNQFLSGKSGHIILYSLLWDQLCKQFAQFELETNLFARQAFIKTFGIPSLKAQDDFNNKWKFQWWLNDVRHLNIRFIVKNKSKMQKFRNYLQNSKKLRMGFLPLVQYFSSIQRYIIKHRQETLIRSIIGYLEKSPNDVIKTFRFALLQTISQTKKKQIVKSGQCPQIEVDFREIIQNFANTNPRGKFLKQANDLPLLLGFGYLAKQKPQQNIYSQNIIQEYQIFLRIKQKEQNDQAKSIFQKKPQYKTKFRFLATSSLLDQVINIIAERQDDFLIVTTNLLNLQILEMDFAGRILDIIYYRIFLSELQQLQVSRTTRMQTQDIIFKIAKCKPFHVTEGTAQKEVKFEITLKDIIDQAINNPEKLILGFQAKIVEIEPNFPRGHKICTKNPLFDFVIIKAKGNEINIQSFDATVGALDTKIAKFKSEKSYDTLKQQIERISTKFNKKVIWNYNLLTFQYQIKQFQKINVRQDLRVMFVNNLQSPPQKDEQNPLPSEKEKETKFVGLNKEFGKLKLGLSEIPFTDHFTFSPMKKDRDVLYNQMKKLAKKVEESNEIEQKK